MGKLLQLIHPKWILILSLGLISLHSNAQDSLRNIAIHKITIVGNRQTKNYIILRELEIKQGDSIIYNQLNKKITKGIQQIYNTTLFVQVTIDSQYISHNEIELYVLLKEKWFIYPLPEFQIVDRSYNEWIQKYHGSLSRVNYGVKFVDNNLTGRIDQLKITLLNGYSRDISINYNAPFANPSLTNGFFIGGGYAQTREIPFRTSFDNQLLYYKKDQFVRNSWNIQTGYTIRKFIKRPQSISIKYNFLNIDDSISTGKYNPNYLNTISTKKGFVDLLYTYQMIDVNNVLYPLNGYTTSIQLQKRGLGFQGGINFFSLLAEYDQYKALRNKWYTSFQLQGMIKLPFDQPYINQQALGYGSAYIRGLEAYVIDGVADFITKFNLKKEILNVSIPTIFKRSKTFNTIPLRIYAKTYVDAGMSYTKEKFNSMLNNKFLYSGGVGIDLVTFYDLQLRIEYSFNQLGQKKLFLHNEKGF